MLVLGVVGAGGGASGGMEDWVVVGRLEADKNEDESVDVDVTVVFPGATVTVTITPCIVVDVPPPAAQPTPLHWKPGMQQPPLPELGQDV